MTFNIFNHYKTHSHIVLCDNLHFSTKADILVLLEHQGESTRVPKDPPGDPSVSPSVIRVVMMGAEGVGMGPPSWVGSSI